MQSRTLAILTACCLLSAIVPARRAEAAAGADLARLVADAATYQSGQNVEALQKIEQLIRDSAGKPALRAELEAALVKLLAPSATFEARRFACQGLMVVGTDASLPALAELLKSDETVGIACLALSSRRSPKLSETLRNALPGARGPARLQIIGALGSHQDAQSVETLAALARGADAAVAEAAVTALGKIGSAPAQAAVLALRKEARPGQARAMTEATLCVAQQLAAAGDRKAACAIYTELLQPQSPANIRRGVLAALVDLDEDGGRQRIADVLRGGDPALTPVAIARVGSLKSADASQAFAAMLPSLMPSAQAWMIEALASRGDAAARQAIRAKLSAADAGVRRAAVIAAGKLDDACAVGPLAKLFANAESPQELQDVEMALGSLRGGAATDEAIIAELKRSSAGAKIRLCSVLARRGARGAVPALLEEAGGGDMAAAQAAFRALGRIAAGADLPALLQKLAALKTADARADAESAAARVMTRIADVAQRSEAVRAALAKSSDVADRCSLLRLLPNAADASALAALRAAAADSQAPVRDAAVRALAAWPDASGWDALLAVCRQPDSDAHRTLVLRALVRIAGELNAKPDAALMERYRQLLAGARGDDDRKLILSALAGAAHPDALQLALSLLPHAGVRAETAMAVRKIAAAVKAQHPQAAEAALKRLEQARP